RAPLSSPRRGKADAGRNCALLARIPNGCHALAASVVAEYGMAEAESLVRSRTHSGAAQARASGVALVRRVATLLLFLLVAACAPTVQREHSPLSTFAGPQFDVEAERFISFDGAQLGLSAWP